LVYWLSPVFALVAPASSVDPVQAAIALEKKGKLQEARDSYRSAGEEFRTAFDKHNLAAALRGGGTCFCFAR
jgi:hypothetical protein